MRVGDELRFSTDSYVGTGEVYVDDERLTVNTLPFTYTLPVAYIGYHVIKHHTFHYPGRVSKLYEKEIFIEAGNQLPF